MAIINDASLFKRKPIIYKDLFMMKKDGELFPDRSLLTESFNTDRINALAVNDEWVNELKTLFNLYYSGNLMLTPFMALSNNARYVNSYMYKNYGRRNLLTYYFDFIDHWDGTDGEIDWILNQVKSDIDLCVDSNVYKWSNLLKSCMLEFNPLWNVDGVEGTIRELKHSGTDTTAKSGKDTIEKTGTETTDIDGTETTTKDGKDTLTDSGTDTLEYKGSQDLSYIGSERDTHNGSESLAYNGSEVDTKGGSVQHLQSRTTTESNTFYDTEKNVDTYNSQTDTKSFNNRSDTKSFTNRYDEKSFTNRKDTTSFTNREDERTLDLTHEQSYDSSVELAHDTTNQTTFDTSNETTYASQLLKTLNLNDEELQMVIRQGNIGVTTTTKLLTEFREYININVVDIIAKDIIKSVTMGVY